MRRIKEKILEIFYGTILFQIGITLLAAFLWFGVFHPFGRILVYGLFLRGPYGTGPDKYDGTIEVILIIFAAISFSGLAMMSWYSFFRKSERRTKRHDAIVRQIIEIENPNIDFDGAANRDIFRRYDNNGHLQTMGLRQLQRLLEHVKKENEKCPTEN